MKSYSLIGVLGAGLAAIAFGACTVNSTTNNNGGDDGGNGGSSGGGDDSSIDGASSSSSGSSSGATSSSGSSSGASGSSSGSSEASTGEGGEGGTCNVSFSVGSTSCDSCVQGSCCPTLMMCDSTDAGGGPTDDAGNTECYNALVCAIQFASTHPDSGLSTDDINTCAGVTGDASATGGAATAISLLDCAMTNCASQCQ